MTVKTTSRILDDAADILEKHGFTTDRCYDPETGGYCALGAIARAAFPRSLASGDIDDIAYRTTDDSHRYGDSNTEPESSAEKRYAAAVLVAAKTISRKRTLDSSPAYTVYDYNDGARSPKWVVKMLRRAAASARKAPTT